MPLLSETSANGGNHLHISGAQAFLDAVNIIPTTRSFSSRYRCLTKGQSSRGRANEVVVPGLLDYADIDDCRFSRMSHVMSFIRHCCFIVLMALHSSAGG